MLTISTTLIQAKVVDPKSNVDLTLRLKDSSWIDWLLIEEQTLRDLNADAKGYEAALSTSIDLQFKLGDVTDKYNALQLTHYQGELDKVSLQKRIHALENPPWYKHYSFWGVTGVTVGVILAATLVFFAGS